MTRPNNINPVEWEQGLVIARSICAEFFKNGGKPIDALKAYGIYHISSHPNWQVAIDNIAYVKCTRHTEKFAA